MGERVRTIVKTACHDTHADGRYWPIVKRGSSEFAQGAAFLVGFPLVSS